MKKIFFALFAVAMAYQANAQQSLLKPSDPTLLNKLYSPFQVKPIDSSLYGKLFKLQPIEGYNQQKTPLSIADEEVFYSTMPVIKIGIESKMPVAKLNGSGGNYTMLIKKYKVVNPLIKVQPATP